jgi:hypothetical protein
MKKSKKWRCMYSMKWPEEIGKDINIFGVAKAGDVMAAAIQ